MSAILSSQSSGEEKYGARYKCHCCTDNVYFHTLQNLSDHITDSHGSRFEEATGDLLPLSQRTSFYCDKCRKIPSVKHRHNQFLPFSHEGVADEQIDQNLAMIGSGLGATTVANTNETQFSMESANLFEEEFGNISKEACADLIASFQFKAQFHYYCDQLVNELCFVLLKIVNKENEQISNRIAAYTAFSILPGLVHMLQKQCNNPKTFLSSIVHIRNPMDMVRKILNTASARKFQVVNVDTEYVFQSDSKIIRLVENCCKDGHLSKAYALMKSLKEQHPLPPLSRQKEIMKALNPEGDDFAPLPIDENNKFILFGDIALSDRIKPLEKIISGLRNNSSHGSSGWNNALIKRICSKGKGNLTRQILLFFDSFCNGTVPFELAYLFTMARGVIIPKSNGKFRPIAISDAWYRLLGKVAVVHFSCLLAPLQLGIRVRGGVEIAARLGSLAYEHDNFAISTFDLENAFNCMPREVVARAISKHSPSFLALFNSLYAHRTEIRHSNGSLMCFNSIGVRQGDPLSSYFFCVGLQDTLATIQATCRLQHTNAFTFAIIDDITIAAPTECIHSLTEEVIDILVRDGFKVNRAKCNILGKNIDNGLSGVNLLGIPVGTVEYMKQSLIDKFEMMLDPVYNLLRLNPQSALKLLKFCVNSQPNYISRTVEWPFVEKFLKDFDVVVTKVLLELFQIKIDDFEIVARLRGLNDMLGGVMLPRHGTVSAQKGQFQARQRTKDFIMEHSDLFFLEPTRATYWSNLYFDEHMEDYLGDKEKNNRYNGPVMNVPLARKKSRFNIRPSDEQVVFDVLQQKYWAVLFGQLPNSHGRALLRSFSYQHSAKWMYSWDAMRMTDEDYKRLVRWRLLTNPFTRAEDICCTHPSCSKTNLVEFPSHSFTCKRNQISVNNKHNRICGILAEAIKANVADAEVQREVPFYNARGNEVRADLVINLRGTKTLLDVTIINSASKSRVNLASEHNGVSARWAEHNKIKKYNSIPQVLNKEFNFVPFAVEIGGFIGVAANKYLASLDPGGNRKIIGLLKDRIRSSLAFHQALQLRNTQLVIDSPHLHSIRQGANDVFEECALDQVEIDAEVSSFPILVHNATSSPAVVCNELSTPPSDPISIDLPPDESDVAVVIPDTHMIREEPWTTICRVRRKPTTSDSDSDVELFNSSVASSRRGPSSVSNASSAWRGHQSRAPTMSGSSRPLNPVKKM